MFTERGYKQALTAREGPPMRGGLLLSLKEGFSMPKGFQAIAVAAILLHSWGLLRAQTRMVEPAVRVLSPHWVALALFARVSA